MNIYASQINKHFLIRYVLFTFKNFFPGSISLKTWAEQYCSESQTPAGLFLKSSVNAAAIFVFPQNTFSTPRNPPTFRGIDCSKMQDLEQILAAHSLSHLSCIAHLPLQCIALFLQVISQFHCG